MIDTICEHIPEWRREKETVTKIKRNTSCMLENIERVLVELLQQRNKKETDLSV